MIFELTKYNSIANQYISELRDIQVQSDKHKFRNNARRIGILLAYEISKTLDFKKVEIQQSPYEKMDRSYYSHPFLGVFDLVNSFKLFHTVTRN